MDYHLSTMDFPFGQRSTVNRQQSTVPHHRLSSVDHGLSFRSTVNRPPSTAPHYGLSSTTMDFPPGQRSTVNGQQTIVYGLWTFLPRRSQLVARSFFSLAACSFFPTPSTLSLIPFFILINHTLATSSDGVLRFLGPLRFKQHKAFCREAFTKAGCLPRIVLYMVLYFAGYG